MAGEPEYLPAAQSLQVDAEVAPIAAEYLPAAQSLQVDAEVAAIAAEYLPASQSLHGSDDLSSSVYLPAAQGILVCAPAESEPPGQ